MHHNARRRPAEPTRKNLPSFWGDLNLRPSRPKTPGLPTAKAVKLIRRFARKDE